LNAAACVVSSMQNFHRGLSRLLHTELHWLDVPEQVMYKLGMVKRLRTSQNCANQSQVSHRGNISDLPAARSCTTPPVQLLLPTGFLCGWSVSLEFPAGHLAGSSYWRKQF